MQNLRNDNYKSNMKKKTRGVCKSLVYSGFVPT